MQRLSMHAIAASLVWGYMACSPGGSAARREMPELMSAGGAGAAITSQADAAVALGGGAGAAAGGAMSPRAMSPEAMSLGADAGKGAVSGAGGDASSERLDAGASGPTAADDGGAKGNDAGAAPDAGVSIDPALAARLASLSARLTPLAERTFEFWRAHGPDVSFDGFHGTLDRQGNPIAPDDKGLIQQTRHLWTLSTWYERREASAEVAALAGATYAFIEQSFIDATDGAFVFKVSRDGSRVVDAKKQLFAESYAIYALATYGRVFSVAEATLAAQTRFEAIDESRHDSVFGGYDQRGDPGVGTPGVEKDTNTHLHLMEAFTALYEATGDALVAARLSELVDVVAERLLQPEGYVHADFGLDFTLRGAPRVSYGHDLETAWLLLEAARVLGREGEAGIRAAALAMAQHSAERGADTLRGGYFEAGTPGGAVNDFDKIWWVQFEALAGLWWAYELSRDPAHLDRLEATLDWIEQSEDVPNGEWFAATNADGSPAGVDYKGDEWKASYHSVRALVFVQDWITAELTRYR